MMKLFVKLLPYILTSFLFISCESNDDSIFYTINYQVVRKSTSDKIDTTILNHIIEITKDSFYFHWLINDFYDSEYEEIESFKLLENTDDIIVQDYFKPNNNIKINLTDSTIHWKDKSSDNTIDIYGYRLDEYKCGSKDNMLMNIFKENEIYFSEYNSFIEFNENGFIVADSDEFSLGLNGLWDLREIGQELFLIIDGYPSNSLQVCNVSTDSLKFKFNGFGTKYYNTEIVKKDIQDNPSIYGEWTEFSVLKHPVPFVSRSDSNYYLYRSIDFKRDSMAIIRSHYAKDTIPWIYNQFYDKIIFPSQWQSQRSILTITSDDRSETLLNGNVFKDRYGNKKEKVLFTRNEKFKGVNLRKSRIVLDNYEDILVHLNTLEFTSGVYGEDKNFYKSDLDGFYGFYNLFDLEFNYLAYVIVWVEGTASNWKSSSSNQTVVFISTKSDIFTFWNNLHIGMERDVLLYLLGNYRELDNGNIVYFDNGGDVFEIELTNSFVSSINYSYISDHSKFFK